MDAEIVSNCVGPLSRLYLSGLPHHVAPCMNLHRVLPCEEDSDPSSLFLRPSPYSSTVPVPLTPLSKVTRGGANGLDPTKTLIREKLKWQMKKDRILKAVRNDKKHLSGKTVKRAVKVPVNNKAVLPQGVLLLAQHLDKDPDPSFSGAYNWHYTGGTLATLKQEEDNYLLHASQSKLNYSRIVEGNLCESSAVDLKEEEIFQVVSNSKGAAVRQKSKVSILAVTESDKERFLLNQIRYLSEKEDTFLGVALPANSIRKFCTLSASSVLKLWDLEYSKSSRVKLQFQPGEGITVSDGWSSIRFMDKKTLLLADRCCLHVLDVRANFKEKQLAWCPKKILENCEELSYVACSSLRDKVVYIASSHQLLCLDLRAGFCQRWTHMMAIPPHMGFTQVMDNDRELVCLGSQAISECVTVVNEWRGSDPQSMYRPARLPSPGHSLQLARQQGVCLDPFLTQRCTQSMTGLACLSDNCGLQVVRQSATADVFIQQLTSSNVASNHLSESELARFSEWCKPTLSLKRDPSSLAVTEVKDFSPVFKVLTSDTMIETATKDEEVEAPGGNGWRLSKRYLEDCVDLLAGRLLATWGVEEEEEWVVTEIEGGEGISEQDPSEKVMNWLDAANSANTFNDRSVTGISKMKPTVTSTPFPPPVVEQDISPVAVQDPTPWMNQSSQLTHHTPRKGFDLQDALYDPSEHMLSPPSSAGSTRRRKRLKMFHDTTSTPPKQPTSAKKPQSSVKKKFIPGF